MLSELVSLPRLIHGTENFRLEVSWKSSRPKIAIRQRGSSQTTRWTYTASDCNYEKAIKLGNDMAPRLHVCLCVCVHAQLSSCSCLCRLRHSSFPALGLGFFAVCLRTCICPRVCRLIVICVFFMFLSPSTSLSFSLSLWLSFPRLGCLYLALRLTRSLCPTLSLLSIYLPISLPFVLCFSLCFSLFLSPSLVN